MFARSLKLARRVVLLSAIVLTGCATQHPPTPASAPDHSEPAPSASPASSAPMVAIVTRAEWCSVCKANGARAGQLLMRFAERGDLEIVMNDITDEQSAKKSAGALASKGLLEVLGPAPSPGVVLFVDARSRRPVGQITVAHADAEIQAVTEHARATVQSKR